MVIVHHLNNSRSQRVLWLLEELEVPYEIKAYSRNPKTLLAPAELKAVHPLGKSPVITVDGHTIAESGAIAEYLLDFYGEGKGLRPNPKTPERLKFNYWMHYAEGSLMPLLVMTLIFSQVPKAKMPFFIKPIAKQICKKVQGSFIQPQLVTHFDFLESELQKNKWFAGANFSAADIHMSYPIAAAAARGGLTGRYGKLREYVESIQARPAYKRALEKGGPYGVLN